jgi:hypothetical protein
MRSQRPRSPRGGRPEAAIEVAHRSTLPTIASSGTTWQPEVGLADPAERLDDLLEREDQRDVVGLAPQPAADVGQQPRAARAREVD